MNSIFLNRRRLYVTAFLTASLTALFVTTAVFAAGEETPENAPRVSEPEPVATEDPKQEQLVEPPLPAPEGETSDGQFNSVEPPVEEIFEDEVPSEEILIEEGAPADLSLEGKTPDVEEVVAEIQADENEVVVADAAGEPIDMASQQSADLLTSGDPWWMVGTTKYMTNFPGGCPPGTKDITCWESENPIDEALTRISGGLLPSNRLLYVEEGTYNGFSIDGEANSLLSLLKGVIGVDGSQTTIINGDITVSKTKAGFTLQGFTIQSGGGISFSDNIGTLQISDVVVKNSNKANAIEVASHAGAVLMDGVDSSNNQYNGANIDNSIGKYPITITNSAFNQNGDATSQDNWGLSVKSKSTITLTGIAANKNKGDGVIVNSSLTLKITDVYLEENSSDIAGYGYGLKAALDGSGTAYLDHVYALGNDYGILVEGGNLQAKYINANQNVEGAGFEFSSLVGGSRVEYSSFIGNYLEGLKISNKGAIYLNSINANDNGAQGGYLENDSSVTITSTKSGGFLQLNSFSGNGAQGIYIDSRGNVTISNADFSNNEDVGLDIDNTRGSGSVTLNTTTANWSNWVGYNAEEGIQINSKGTVDLRATDVEANGGAGIQVTTQGAIALTNINSFKNLGMGAILDNSSATTPRSVSITNSRFDQNGGKGIKVDSKGEIAAKGLAASENSRREVNITTSAISYHDLVWEEGIEDLFTFTGTAGQTINLNLDSDDFNAYLELWDPDGTLETSDDDSGGGQNAAISGYLLKSGTYTVVVKSIDGAGEYWFSFNDPAHSNPSSNEDYQGADLNNTYGTSKISLNTPTNKNRLWGNLFNNNAGDGLEVRSNGAIYLNSASAEQNFLKGVDLENPASRGSVSVVNLRTDGFTSSFSENGEEGLVITTLGNVVLQDINAQGNGSTGVWVDNCQVGGLSGCTGFGGVQLLARSNRYNAFSQNNGYGLYVRSFGEVLLTNILAGNNVNQGLFINNADAVSTAGITLAVLGNGIWNDIFENGNGGMTLNSNGNIALNYVNAFDNGGVGADISNRESLFAATVSITRGQFYGNDAEGLKVISKGDIVWKFGGAWENGLIGAYLSNYTSGGFGSVTVQGSTKERMSFDENGCDGAEKDGLFVESRGKVTLGYILANDNNGFGVQLSNENALSNQPVSITEIDVNTNEKSGLEVRSKGPITLKGIQSTGNLLYGAMLSNNSGKGNVSVTTTSGRKENSLGDNGSTGLYIRSAGNVSLKNISAFNNVGHGIDIDNTFGTGGVTYQSTGSLFVVANNGQEGLNIVSRGNVNITNQYGLVAVENGGYGIFITNDFPYRSNYVKLTNVLAVANPLTGIYVQASGYIYAISLTAHANGQEGVKLVTSSAPITVTGSNLVSSNGFDGLYATSVQGKISISNVVASSNTLNGIHAVSTTGNISITGSTAKDNHQNGLCLESTGNFYLKNARASGNGKDDAGQDLDDGLNITAGDYSVVTIIDSTFMNNWFGSGIEIKRPNPDRLPLLTRVNYLSNGETNLWVHS